MFLYDFLQLEIPFEEVRSRLLAGGADGLGGALPGDPTYDGEVIELDRPLEQDDVLALPFRWLSSGAPRLFPAVDGHLEVSRLGPSGTHVSLLANYTPPGGYFGRLADRMGLHHLVEGRARVFLRRIAEGLAGTGERVAA